MTVGFVVSQLKKRLGASRFGKWYNSRRARNLVKELRIHFPGGLTPVTMGQKGVQLFG